MTDETVEAVETQEQAPTMEDISREFNVEEQVQSFQAKPEQEQSFNDVYAPDPITNPDAYERYARQQAQSLQMMNKTIKELNDKIGSFEMKTQQQAVEADIKAAVAKVNSKLEADEKMAEIALRMEYEKDPHFQRVWDNRHKNPKAFEKALDVIADQYSGVLKVKQDPQLTANQLAAKKSMKTMGRSPEPQDEWDGLSQGEFEQKWNEMLRG